MTVRLLVSLALASFAAILTLVPNAVAAPPPPEGLEVAGGAGWRADGHFDLRWSNPVVGPPVAAVHYEVRDPLGALVIGPKRIDWPALRIENLRVWRLPGIHTAEVWLEDGSGGEGAAAEARLRFDDVPPGPSEPIRVPGWVGDAELPLAIHLTHPPAPEPASGIRGYAVSVDRGPEGSPCAGAALCTDAETDLRSGANEDSVVVDGLPEGVSYVHSVAVSGSGMRSASVGRAVLRVDRSDPLTRLTGLPEGWTNRAVVLRATATDSASGMAPDGEGAPFTAIRVDADPPSLVAGSSVGTTVIEPGVHTVAYYARDAAGNVNDGETANGHRNAPPSRALVRIDRDPPSVFLVGSAGPSDPELIEARVGDDLSGPDPLRGSIAVRPAGSNRSFEELPSAIGGGLLQAWWRSDDYPRGDYEFRATAFDAAGNSASTTKRANGSSLVLPSPLKASTTLSLQLGDGASERVVPYGRGPVLSGWLVDSSGSPAAGLPIRVVERFEPGARAPEQTTRVLTGPGGEFALHLTPGPSRIVTAQFDGTRARTRAASGPVRLRVRSGLRLRASSALARVGGRPVVFSGAVAATERGEIPAGGVAVQLQFRLPGLPWAEFRTVQTDRRGRFRYPYRFSDDDSRGVRFRFRAYAPAQGDWPYEPGGSRPVAVRGS